MAGRTAFSKPQDANFRSTGELNIINDLRVVGSTLVYQVNDCETVGDWVENNNGTWDVAANSADTRSGTNAMQFSTTAATDGTQYVETLVIEGSALPVAEDVSSKLTYSDWSDTDYLGGWVSNGDAADFNTAGEAQLSLITLSGTGEKVESSKFNFPAVVDTVHQRWEFDISSVANLSKVHAIRVYGNNAATGQDIRLDAIIRYKHSNGKGPVWGPCIQLPIASGQVLTRGNLVQINPASANGIDVQAEAAADAASGGIVVVGGTGTAAGGVYATIQVGGYAYARASGTITTGGEGLIWGAGHTVTLVASAAAEVNVIARAVEVPGAATDDFLIELGGMGSFVA